MNQLSSCFISPRPISCVISKHIVYDETNMVVLLWIWPGQVLVLGPTKTLRPAQNRAGIDAFSFFLFQGTVGGTPVDTSMSRCSSRNETPDPC